MNNKGKLWEIEAANYLRGKKYTLLEANYSSRYGEIDLIVKNKKYICFVEVKQRDVNSIASPGEFVDFGKQQRIITTAQLYLASINTNLQPRFDVIEIYTKDNKLNSIKHLENAFELV